MARKRKQAAQEVRLADGGTVAITASESGGFSITVTRGYKETPEERRERLAHSRRGGVHQGKSSRAASKREAIRLAS